MPAPLANAIDLLIHVGGISAVVFVLLMLIKYVQSKLSPTRIDASDLSERLSFSSNAFRRDLMIFLGVLLTGIFAVTFVQYGLSTSRHAWTAGGVFVGLLSCAGLPAVWRFGDRARECSTEVARLKSILAGRCPACGGSLSGTDSTLNCLTCHATFVQPSSLRRNQTTNDQ